MVLFLHNRYRTTGGEERAVEDLMWLVREQLGEPAELLGRDSAGIGRAGAALGLLRGGLRPEEVAKAVRLSGARVVHAHNLHPAFGWRALAAARSAGARVVLHLHQYRLVCAIGVCFTRGEDCTRCHGRDTLPGVRLNCRGSRAEAVAYGAGLALWQHRLVEQADEILVPSAFARERLRALGAPLPWGRVRVLAPPLRELSGAGAAARSPAAKPSFAARPSSAAQRPARTQEPAPAGTQGAAPYALVVSRLAVEKGVDIAVEACRIAGVALIVAGDGPELESLRRRGAGADVRLLGRVDDATLAGLRAGAALALAPSRSAETFGLAVAEAMAAGLPVAASRVGAIGELLEEDALVAPGDARALAEAIARLAGDRAAGMRNLERVRAVCAPEIVAGGLREAYGGDGGRQAQPST
jgi:glycosyltransferase involved in cell wall biosynthesis